MLSIAMHANVFIAHPGSTNVPAGMPAKGLGEYVESRVIAISSKKYVAKIRDRMRVLAWFKIACQAFSEKKFVAGRMS